MSSICIVGLLANLPGAIFGASGGWLLLGHLGVNVPWHRKFLATAKTIVDLDAVSHVALQRSPFLKSVVVRVFITEDITRQW